MAHSLEIPSLPSVAFLDTGAAKPMQIAANSKLAHLPLEEQLDALRAAISKAASTPGATAINAATIVYDGFLTVDDQRGEAVLVESFELGQPAGVVFGQQYLRKRGIRRAKPVGSAVLLRADLPPMY